MAGKRGRPRKHPAQEVKEEIKKILDEPKIANIKLSEEDTQLVETIKSNETSIKKENDALGWDVKIDDPVEYFDPELSYEITGYRPIDKTRGLDFDPKLFMTTRFNKETKGKFCLFRKGSKAYDDFWTEEYIKCRNGLTINGYTLTGDNYYFINYYQLFILDQTNEAGAGRPVGFPNFFVKQYEYFHYIALCKKLKKNAVGLKARGVGFSEIAAAIAVNTYNCRPKSRVVITAFSADFVDRTFAKCRVQLDYLNTESDEGFKKLRQVKDQSMHVRASTIQNKNEVGWGSEIEGIIGDKPRKIRGDRTDILLYEESGSWPNWEKAFIQGDALVGVTGNRFGIKFAWGTGGDSGPALQGLAKAFYNPQLFDVMPFKSKYNNKGEDAITAYFIPAYTMVNLPGIIDSRGYCDPELGKKYYEKDRAAKAADPSVLLIFSAEYCFTPEEALALEGDNKFNTELLSEQLARINIHKELPPDGAIQSGHLDYTFKGERKDENITGFHWIPSPTGKIKILEHPKTDSDGNVFRNLYIAGIDGIDLGQSETSENTRDPSDFAIVIKRRSFGMQPPTIVCIYKDRPANIKDAHITAVKLLRYYNCQALIEKSKISFITYCRDKGLASKLLLRTPRSCLSDILNGRSTAFGAPATVPIIEHQLDLIAEYVEEYYYCLWFPEIIEELIKYSFEAKRKFDLVAAFGMCELADEEMAGVVVRQEETSINKIRKFGYYYDEDGIKRYGQIPDTNKFETRVNLNKRNDNARIRTSDPRRYG